ncbi:MAG: type II secretion system minor pseudopilin GspK [Proteobacteria bacterium]|nr:type II secretion system minor pseudopilin GspK [Pseudomonadota bacterium]MDA0993856.1 type II secretion system minor pseudopilin GspK [Pseudomonadota bacterium]
MRKLLNDRGVALITAMLISALAAMVAANLAWDNALDVRRTIVLLNRDQAVQVALGAESWIINILHQDLEESQSDHLAELWASDLPPLPIDNGEVFGAIEDLQGRFNVNNLIDSDGQIDQESLEQFRRLLNALGLDPRFAGITADWIDSDQDASFPDGAEDSIYTGFIPPYRSPNQAINAVSELAAIEAMDRATFTLLEPHITALPGRTAINANTATPAVLLSLDENMTTADVESLVTERESGGFADIETSFASLVTPDVLNRLDESTQFFRLKVIVRIDTVRITLYSILQRGPRGDVTPILRSLGTT